MNDRIRNDDKAGNDDNPAATQSRRAEREARLAEALRANLRRRKAQERGRSSANPAPGDSDGGSGEDRE